MGQTRISCAVPFQVAQQNHYATLSIDVTNRLAQGWDGNNVVNAWDDRTETNATKKAALQANQPILTPNVIVGGGFSLTDRKVTWYRLDTAADQIGDSTKITEITIDESDNNEYELPSKDYKYNPATGALRIVRNLASDTNQDADTFVCKVTGNVKGTPLASPLMRAVQATIMPVGADGYLVVVDAHNGTDAQSTTLSSDVKETWLRCSIFAANGTSSASTPQYTWRKGGSAWTPTATNGASIVKVVRDDVDWQEVFSCSVEIDGAQIGIGSITITDQADDYKVEADITGVISSGNTSTGLLSFNVFKDTVDGLGIGQWQTFSFNGSYVVKLLDSANSQVHQHSAGDMSTTDNGHKEIQLKTEDMHGIEAGTLRVEVEWADQTV